MVSTLSETTWKKLVEEHGREKAMDIVRDRLQSLEDFYYVLSVPDFEMDGDPFVIEIEKLAANFAKDYNEQMLFCRTFCRPLTESTPEHFCNLFILRAIELIKDTWTMGRFLQEILYGDDHDLKDAADSRAAKKACGDKMADILQTFEAIIKELPGIHDPKLAKVVAKHALNLAQNTEHCVQIAGATTFAADDTGKEFTEQCCDKAFTFAKTRKDYGLIAGLGNGNEFSFGSKAEAFRQYLRLSRSPEEVRDVLRGDSTRRLEEAFVAVIKGAKFVQRYLEGFKTIQECLKEFASNHEEDACDEIVYDGLFKKTLDL